MRRQRLILTPIATLSEEDSNYAVAQQQLQMLQFYESVLYSTPGNEAADQEGAAEGGTERRQRGIGRA